MKILGIIENRTENWKTARIFAPFFQADALQLAQRLAKPLGATVEDVWLELFWKGMRDFLAVQKQNHKDERHWKDQIGRIYGKCFSGLRDQVESHDDFRALKEHNYNGDDVDGLYDNLCNTEIDIVIQTNHHLFIGEAKGESDLHARSDLVLVHQLVRQFVMANILVELCDSSRKVVPFVVGVNKKQQQVQFMMNQGWLREENILSWECVKNLSA